MFKNFVKVPIYPNTKTPAISGWATNEYKNKKVQDGFNVAIITGKKNNIIVVDVDEPDNGLTEFKKYTDIHGEPQTVKQATPNGGHHYSFTYKHRDTNAQYLIDNCMKNKSKYREKGLDVRTNGGYILTSPSRIDNKEYKFIRGFEDTEMLEIPISLINFLLMGATAKTSNDNKAIKNQIVKNINTTNSNNVSYDVSDDEIKKYLELLPSSYLNNYNEWLICLTVFKNMNKFELFDEFSKKSPKYNYNNNVHIWNNNKGLININYLIRILKNEGHNIKYLHPYKTIEHITNKINCKSQIFNTSHIDDKNYTYDIFKKFDTHILKSSTGTGKTTITAQHISRYINDNNENLKIMTISPRITLCKQHIKSFSDANINLLSYDDKDINIYGSNLTICLKSLFKFSSVPKSYFNNYIIYIDEITSFLQSLTHNDTLDRNIKQIYKTLMMIIKNCHKIIVSDAIINDNTYNFLNCRPDDKQIYLINEFQKYTNIKAIRKRNENEFTDSLLNNCKNNKPFLYASDSNRTITNHFNLCVSHAKPEDKHKYVLITADTNFKLTDATEQFKNCFVFYSPKITYGVDFNIDEKQDVSIYVEGNSLLPDGNFQQATRTRKIKNLYWFSVDTEHEPDFNTIEEINLYYSEIENLNNGLNNVCLNLDINEDETILKNTFFKMFIYNEYIKDAYKTNICKHFEILLKINGFELKSEGVRTGLIIETQNEMQELTEEAKIELFNNFLLDEEREDEIYTNINNNITALSLENENNETLQKYQFEILDKFKINDSYNLKDSIKMIYIDMKIEQIEKKRVRG